MKYFFRYAYLMCGFIISVVCICGCNDETGAISSDISQFNEMSVSEESAFSFLTPSSDDSSISQTDAVSSEQNNPYSSVDSTLNETSSAKNSSVFSDESTQSETSTIQNNEASSVSEPTIDRTLWKRKMIAITFDDGPHETNPQLLDMLKEKDIKVTFFMLGENMEKRSEIVKRAIAEGHDVGYHSYRHSISVTSLRNTVSQDFDKAQSIMDKIVDGYKITLYRGPGGGASDVVKSEAAKRDWRIINWSNYNFNDQLNQDATPQERMTGVYDEGIVTNGSVLLIHPRDNQDILDGIGLLIDRLKADGYECVTVSELLKRRKGGTAGTVYGSTPIY